MNIIIPSIDENLWNISHTCTNYQSYHLFEVSELSVSFSELKFNFSNLRSTLMLDYY